jgi:hypothetical protein
MADTTRRSSDRDKSEPRKKTKRAYTRPALLVSALAIVMGVVLLAMGIPRTVAAWTALGAEPAMDKLRHDEAPTAEELAQCIEASERAIEWTPSAVRFATLGSCEFARARQTPTGSPDRGRWLDLAAAHTEQSLLRDPADGFTWIRLAMIREMHGAAAREIIPPLMMSLEMTPNSRLMWSLRSEMLLSYARLLTPEDSAAVRRHLHTIWTFSPPHRPVLLEIAHRLNRLDVLQAALTDDPEAKAEIEIMERQSRFP